jgi:hypothetical protein
MAARAPSSLAAIRLEAAKTNGVPAPQNPNPLPRLSFTKPSLVVKTEASSLIPCLAAHKNGGKTNFYFYAYKVVLFLVG